MDSVDRMENHGFSAIGRVLKMASRANRSNRRQSSQAKWQAVPKGAKSDSKSAFFTVNQRQQFSFWLKLPSFRAGCRNPGPWTVTCRLHKCLIEK
jgi:hypothetical protein